MYRVEDKYTCTEGDMLILQSKLNTVLNRKKIMRMQNDIVLPASILTIIGTVTCMMLSRGIGSG